MSPGHTLDWLKNLGEVGSSVLAGIQELESLHRMTGEEAIEAVIVSDFCLPQSALIRAYRLAFRNSNNHIFKFSRPQINLVR